MTQTDLIAIALLVTAITLAIRGLSRPRHLLAGIAAVIIAAAVLPTACNPDPADIPATTGDQAYHDANNHIRHRHTKKHYRRAA